MEPLSCSLWSTMRVPWSVEWAELRQQQSPVRHQSGIWDTFCRESRQALYLSWQKYWEADTGKPGLTHFIQLLLRVICFFHSSVYFLLPPLPNSQPYQFQAGSISSPVVGWGGVDSVEKSHHLTPPPRQTIMAQTFFNSDRTDINITLAEVQPWTGRIQFTVIYRANNPLDRNMKSVSLAVRPATGSLNVKIK